MCCSENIYSVVTCKQIWLVVHGSITDISKLGLQVGRFQCGQQESSTLWHHDCTTFSVHISNMTIMRPNTACTSLGGVSWAWDMRL